MVPLHSNRRIAALEVFYLGMLLLLGRRRYSTTRPTVSLTP